MADVLGIIVGTSFHFSEAIRNRPVQTVATPFGEADIADLGGAVVAFRHGKDGDIPAHRVNHPANLTALKAVGARWVIGFQSVGSLKEAIAPGSLLIPHDYISLAVVPTLFSSNHDPHIVPEFDEAIRQSVVRLLRGRGISFFERGVYWQTLGPRFETRAEIAFISRFADCVGMTAASEATIAQEAGLAYGCVCSVDNYAHGIGSSPLSEERFHQVVKENTEKMETILGIVLKNGENLACPS